MFTVEKLEYYIIRTEIDIETAMEQREVRRVCAVPSWSVWAALIVFLIVHFAVLIFYNNGSIEKDAFIYYSNVTEVATHVFALPSLLDTNIAGIREVVCLATVVSTVYHYLENFTESEQTGSWHTMDRATATGLVSTVFLKFLMHMHHTDAILIFLVGIASSVTKHSGNVIAAGIVATIFFAVLFRTAAQGIFQSILKVFIRTLSLGGSVPETAVTNIDSGQLVVALVLNTLAVVAFVYAEYNKEYDQWAHSIWHAVVYTVLWLLIRILVSARNQKGGVARKDREVYETLLPSRRGRTRLGTGRWS